MSSGCFFPELGQLLNIGGMPNASYWVMVDYAAMHGDRVRSQVSSIDLSALAVTSDAGVTRLLIGRHKTCSQPTTGAGNCEGPAVNPPAAPAVVKVLLRTGAQSARVGIQLIPNTRSDLTAPPRTRHETVPVQHGVATIRLRAVADGAAAFLTVRPDADIGAAASTGIRSHREVPPASGPARSTRILPSAGARQRTTALHAFPKPLVALVTDQYGDAIAGRRVTFALPAGFAHFSGGAHSVTTRTDRYGVARSPTIVAGLLAQRQPARAYLAGLGDHARVAAAYFELRVSFT
jgi:hypothetical protein